MQFIRIKKSKINQEIQNRKINNFKEVNTISLKLLQKNLHIAKLRNLL